MKAGQLSKVASHVHVSRLILPVAVIIKMVWAMKKKKIVKYRVDWGAVSLNFSSQKQLIICFKSVKLPVVQSIRTKSSHLQ